MLPLIRERMWPRVFSAIGSAIGMDASQHGKEALSKVAADGIDHPAPAQATSRRLNTVRIGHVAKSPTQMRQTGIAAVRGQAR